MRKKRFLQLLESKLSILNEQEKTKILANYEKMIDKRVKNGEKESAVIKSFGKIDELANKIIDSLKNNNSKKVLNTLKNLRSKTGLFFKNSFNNIKNKLTKKSKKEEKSQTVEIVKTPEKVENPIVIESTKSEPIEIEIKEEVKKIELKLSLKYKIYGLLLSFSLVFFIILFLIASIGVLDGTVFLGIDLTIATFLFFIYIAINLWYKKVFSKSINYKKIFYMIIINLILCGLSIGFTVFTYYRYEEVDDVSNYYVMAKEIKNFDLPVDETIKYYLDFNSNYKSKYRISYDDTLDNDIKVEVNYYRNYYKLNYKVYRNSLYVSFHKSFRNSLSTFLEGIRDRKIYNKNELQRYTITIYMNSKDKDRIIINN